LHGDPGSAGTALPLEYEVADQGKVVQRMDGTPAGGAMRTGKGERLFFRNPVDADVKETSDTKSEGDDVEIPKCGTGQNFTFES